MSKHVHKFMPTGRRQGKFINDNRWEFLVDTANITFYNDICYEFICECGKTKWVKEK